MEDDTQKTKKILVIMGSPRKGNTFHACEELRGMLEKDAYCVDILVQVAAANAALNSFSRELLAQHIGSCVADDLRAGSNEKLEELLRLLPKLMK